MEGIVGKIKSTFSKRFPNYPVLAIWDAGDSYLVALKINSGKELADGYFKVDKRGMTINEKWGYQKNIEEFKRVISQPAMYISKESS